jgi:hypothetical protein
MKLCMLSVYCKQTRISGQECRMMAQGSCHLQTVQNQYTDAAHLLKLSGKFTPTRKSWHYLRRPAAAALSV